MTPPPPNPAGEVDGLPLDPSLSELVNFRVPLLDEGVALVACQDPIVALTIGDDVGGDACFGTVQSALGGSDVSEED